MWFLLPAVALLMAAFGCARSKVHYEEIFRNDRVHVRLAERLDKSGDALPGGCEHPWDVDVDVLDDMLGSVAYKKGKMLIGGGSEHDAFPGSSRYVLLEPLKKAFARAGPSQVVDFAFLEEQSTLKVFRRVYLTDGILFRKGGELNIAFRNIAFQQIAGGEEDDYEPNREDPLESPMRTSWTLVAGDGQSLATGGGAGLRGTSTYTNWVKLDLDWPWGVSDRAIFEKALPGEPAPPEPVTPSRAELEERLLFLEELRREGMIAERDYIEKKQELDRLFKRLPK
jgi:hypothetical protein